MASDKPGTAAAGVEPGSATILNVNDDEANRYAVSYILRRAGLDVREAATGEEALRLASEGPDLVILDVHLPDLDGFEVCRRIKEDPATAALPVIHLSARYVKPEHRVHGLQGGADGYLVQPVQPPELVATVRSLLRLRQAERDRARAEAAAQLGADRIAQLERELKVLERMTGPTSTAVTAQLFGDRPWREAYPDLFGEAVRRFGELLDLALDQREYQVSHPLSDGLRAISDRAGLLRAGPRDVVDIYSESLRRKTAEVPARKARAYVEEGRLLVLELMGHLASYYRLHALGAARMPPPALGEGPGSS